MSNTNPRRFLSPIDPNPDITVPSEAPFETVHNPSSPLETKPFGFSRQDAEVTIQKSSRLEAQFANVSKRKSRSKSRSKSDIDCLSRIQFEAVNDDGQLAVPGQTANEGNPFPSAIKIEPGPELQDALRIDDVKPTEPNITPPSASDSKPNSTTFIPTVKVEIEEQLANVVDVKDEFRGGSPEIVLEKKKGARVKVVSFAPKCTILTGLPQVRCTLEGRTGLTLTGDKIEDLVGFLDGVAGPEGSVKIDFTSP